MAAKILNIEVGDRLVKVCCTIPKRRGSQVLESFMFCTPAGYVSDGLIEKPLDLAALLTAQLEEKKLSAVKTVIFVVSSAKIASREVKLPPVKDKQLAQVIATNAAEYFPVDLSKYHITHCLLERTAGSDPCCRVLVMAAPLVLLEGYFNLADAAGLTIRAIDNGGNSQYQALRGLGVKEATMYVNLDCNSSFVSFIQGDRLLLQRTFAFGGDTMISHYMDDTNKVPDQYLESLNELSLGSPSFIGADTLDKADIEAGLERLISSLVRSADYFNSSRWEATAQQVVLTGPCSHLVGLKELVAAATDLPTIYIDELPGIASLAGNLTNPGAYINCIGASLAPVNLMPAQLSAPSKEDEKPETLTAGFVVCALCVVGALALGLLSVLNYGSAKADLAAANAEIESLQYVEDTYNAYLSYQQGAVAVQLISSQTQQPNAELVSFFEELEVKMPSSILLLSAVCTNEGVSINVTTGSYEDAAAVLKQFRSFESIALVDTPSVTRSTNEAGIARYAFSVACAYGQNPYLNDISPYAQLITPPADPLAPQDAAPPVQ